MRGIGCYSNFSKNSKEEGELLLFFSLVNNLCSGDRIAGAPRGQGRRWSQMCLQSVLQTWLDTTVSWKSDESSRLFQL